MAAGFLSKPGDQYGPCEGECAHRDCALTRQMAATNCRICGEPIGYDRRFFDDGRPGEVVLVHEVCLIDEIEAELIASREARRVTA